MHISIIGSGAVGRTIGTGFIRLSNEVVFYDISKKRLEELAKEGLKTTDDLNFAIQNTEVSFIAVPTPAEGMKINLSYLDAVTKSCGEVLKNKSGFHVFVIKSTQVPGTVEKLEIPNLEKFSGKKHGIDFGVVYNPEFLTMIENTWTDSKDFRKDLFGEDRIVLGEGLDKRAGDLIEQLFKPLGVPIFRRDYKTAEIVKYAANMALAARVSISNEFFRLCKEIGVDGQDIAQIVSIDKRIGKYGSVCGKAFGGTCFPKDLKGAIGFSNEIGYSADLLKAMDKLNEEMWKEFGVRE